MGTGDMGTYTQFTLQLWFVILDHPCCKATALSKRATVHPLRFHPLTSCLCMYEHQHNNLLTSGCPRPRSHPAHCQCAHTPHKLVCVVYTCLPIEVQLPLTIFNVSQFKVHFIFGVDYNQHLNSFYTFIQTTVYNIDVRSAKESPRVKELRARLLHTDGSGDGHSTEKI